LSDLDDAWKLAGKWHFLGHASHHLIPFGRKVDLIERISTSSKGWGKLISDKFHRILQ